METRARSSISSPFHKYGHEDDVAAPVAAREPQPFRKRGGL